MGPEDRSCQNLSFNAFYQNLLAGIRLPCKIGYHLNFIGFRYQVPEAGYTIYNLILQFK